MMRIPPDIKPIEDEEIFDPAVHLALGEPEQIWSLKDFGYNERAIANAPFELAVTTPFRILSAKGVAALNKSVQKLKSHSRGTDRIASFVRGSVFYSKFIRDLCQNEELNIHIAKLAGAPVLPHPMALYQGHLNLKPQEENRDVDRWHTDTVSLDYVLLCTDPKTFEGGHFEYFQCSKGGAIRSIIREEAEPNIIKVDFPEAGYAVLQQGNLVVHRASAVTKGDERTTLVQSFIADNPDFKSVSKLDDCKLVDPHEYLFTEWARYKAFLSKKKIDKLVEQIPYTTDRNLICNELRSAIRDVEEAILEISDTSDGRLLYYDEDALTDLI